MSGIAGALAAGFSPKRILDFVKKLDPKLAMQIGAALKAGHSIEKILGFLNKHGSAVNENLNQQGASIHSKGAYGVHKAVPGMAKAGLAIAGTALGAYALNRALPQAAQAVLGTQAASKPAIPQLPNLAPNVPQIGQQAQNIASAASAAPKSPSPVQPNLVNPADILWKALEKNKTKGLDPSTSALMKVAQNLRRTGQLQSKEDFDKLYDLFLQKKASNKFIPDIARELFQDFDSFKAASSSEESGLPNTKSPQEMPSDSLARRQPLSQTSTTPLPEGNRTVRAMTPPSNLTGSSLMGSIDSSSNRIIQHDFNNLNEIYAKAKEAEKPFNNILQNLTKINPDISTKGLRLKDKERAETKIKQKYGGNAQFLGDVLGGRVFFNNEKALEDIQKELSKHGIVEEDDFLHSSQNKDRFGYRAIHYQINMGNGISAEVQVMPKETGNVFSFAHDLYDRYKRSAPEEMPEKEYDKYIHDANIARKLFDGAWHDYISNSNRYKHGKASQLVSNEEWIKQAKQIGVYDQIAKGFSSGKDKTSILEDLVHKGFDPYKASQMIRSERERVESDQGKVKKLKQPQKAENAQKHETIGNLALTPQGDIGEIEDVRNGIARIKIGEGIKTRKDEDLVKAPVDLEPAVQHIFDNIPEEKKSTKFQSATHFTVPKGTKLSDGTELSVDIPIMLNKFYDGKIAYYLDFPEDKYRAIAQGLYEAKGQGKTGIAEYKPGVVESRGRGHHEEVILNPKYSKDNKNKTWGYALNEYDAFDHIQEIIKKVSRLKRDEKGKIIEPKKRKSNKKSIG